MKKVLEEDAISISNADFISWEKLKNATFFITGATGLIGSSIINALNYINNTKKLGFTVIALVRDVGKATVKFESILNDGMLKFVCGSVEQIPNIDADIDYIIHGASQTASKDFVNKAVETIKTSVLGTINTLELAKAKKAKSYIYLSSMEVYGLPKRGCTIKETYSGVFSTLECRNSYPISKTMCESLCAAYCNEYDVEAKIIRLAQTFGPGVSFHDNRVFAYFGKCVLNKENIVLKTKGDTERSYLYTADAVAAIITVLLYGKKGEAYNAANNLTYCSIAEMAELVSETVANNEIKVEYIIDPDVTCNGFAGTLYMKLDTSKIEALGWHPLSGGYSLDAMFKRMCQSMEEV